MSHSPEPWRVELEEIESTAIGAIIHHGCPWMKHYSVAYLNGERCCNATEDAKRIVACVNACKGIPNKVLNSGVMHIVCRPRPELADEYMIPNDKRIKEARHKEEKPNETP